MERQMTIDGKVADESLMIHSVDKSKCSACDGTGKVECGTCEGSGEVWATCNYGESHRVSCEDCEGEGKYDCDYCEGTGDTGDSEDGEE